MTDSRRDWLYAGLICLFILVLSIGFFTTGVTNWGDDFAAYLNEGMAIADGRFEEQAVLNYEQHPSSLTKEAENGKLVYVWGYPLFQAAIYKLIGFDRVDYSSLIWYKIPHIFSLSIVAGVLYLFFRRRFKSDISAFLALLFCTSGDLFEVINRLYSDLPFLLLSFLTLILMECYAEEEKWSLGIFYGIVLWLTHETRLNGFTICAVAVIGHILRKGRQLLDKKTLCHSLMPYVVFIILTVASEHLWLAPATLNLSDVGTASSAENSKNVHYYWKLIRDYLSDLPGMRIPAVGYAAVVFDIIGLVRKGIKKENLHLTLLMLGTLAVLVMLPYREGLRYLYSILPILLMYMVYGVQTVFHLLQKGAEKKHFLKKVETVCVIVTCVVAAEMLFFSIAAQITRDYINLTHWDEKDEYDVYCDEAIETYRFIQNNTPEDAVIAFAKPRALYLNTQRRSFRPDINDHEIMNADYFLYCKLKYGDFPKVDPESVPVESIMDNEWFTLYEVQKDG